MEFVVKLYEKQRSEGRWFLHEHPAQATSWALTAVEKLSAKEDVITTLADQCQYGLKTPGKYGHPTLLKSYTVPNEQRVDRSGT